MKDFTLMRAHREIFACSEMTTEMDTRIERNRNEKKKTVKSVGSAKTAYKQRRSRNFELSAWSRGCTSRARKLLTCSSFAGYDCDEARIQRWDPCICVSHWERVRSWYERKARGRNETRRRAWLNRSCGSVSVFRKKWERKRGDTSNQTAEAWHGEWVREWEKKERQE